MNKHTKSKYLLFLPTLIAGSIIYIDNYIYNPGQEIKLAVEVLILLGVANGLLVYIYYKKPLTSIVVLMVSSGLYYALYVLISMWLVIESL